jgi:hypothetical protein
MYESIMKKILNGAHTILRDLGLDSLETDTIPAIESDPDGTYLLCLALMSGIQSWILGDPFSEFTLEYWFPGFWKISQLLRQ